MSYAFSRQSCWCLLMIVACLPVHAESLAEIIQQIKPSIVGIATYQATRRPPTKLLGTGFVVAGGTLVATNYHVVDQELSTESFEKLVVLAGTGPHARMLDAKLVASDASSDVALIRIEYSLPAMQLAPPGTVREGEEFAFTGFPVGAVLGLYPVTHKGMVSSITPIAIPAPSSARLSALKITRLKQPRLVYQLDATAYPGNSGSPLYDSATGEVVGILNQVYVKLTKEDVLSHPSGISYAIPIQYLLSLLADARLH